MIKKAKVFFWFTVLGVLGSRFMLLWSTALWAYGKGVYHNSDMPRTKPLERGKRLNIDKRKREDQYATNGHTASNRKTPPPMKPCS